MVMGSQRSSSKIGRQIQDYVASHHLRYGCAPGLELVQSAFAELPAAIVRPHLNPLVRAGLILDEESEAAGLRSRSALPLAASHIPVQGYRINNSSHATNRMGKGSLAFSLAGMGYASPPDSYAILVPDDKMIGANLAKGDYAILAPASMHNGDIVAAILKDELVLRRYIVIMGIPHLMAENPDLPELIPAYKAVIQGVLWASMRIEPCNERISQPKVRKVDYTKPLGSRLLCQPPRAVKPPKRVIEMALPSAHRKKGLYLEVAQPTARFCINEQPAKPTRKTQPKPDKSNSAKPPCKPKRK